MPVVTTPAPSKIAPVSMDRNSAQIRPPAMTTGESESKIQISTYQTTVQSGAAVLYNGDRMWARVTLTLEGAGPVCVGEQANLFPVLSGKGVLLSTGVPTTFNIAKGNRLFIAANSVQRVKVVIEAYPFLETITGLLGAVASALKAPISAAVARVLSKVG